MSMGFRPDLEALVLAVLEGGPLHGYAVAARVKELSERALTVGEGQLYPLLHRLEADGSVIAEWVPQEGKPARKVYRLTEAGLGRLARSRREWSEFTLSVGRVMAPGVVRA